MPVSNANQTVAENIITIDRRRGERRNASDDVATKGATNPPQPRKQRRRHIDPTTCERDYSGDEIEFMRAMDDYKRDAGRMFPTCSEVLEVIRALGYFKLSDAQVEQLGLEITDLPCSEAGPQDDESDEEFGDD
jgi:hypothetical protein